MKKWSFYLFMSFGLAMISTFAQAANLTIHLQDHRHPGAVAYIAVYVAREGANWGDKPVRLLSTSLAEGNGDHLETDLPVGRYALRAFVDTNGNGELDMATSGKPVEPFAFSRAAGAANSLRFNAAVVDVGNNAGLELRFLHPKVTVNAKTAPVGP